MTYEADIVNPSRDRALEKRVALGTLDWLFEWRTTIAEMEAKNELHDRNGTFNLIKALSEKPLAQAFVAPDNDISRKAGFIKAAWEFEKDPERRRAFYYGHKTSDQLEEQLHTRLNKIAAGYISGGSSEPPIYVGRKTISTLHAGETHFSAELFIRTEPLCFYAGKPVAITDYSWMTERFTQTDVDGFKTCNIEIFHNFDPAVFFFKPIPGRYIHLMINAECRIILPNLRFRQSNWRVQTKSHFMLFQMAS